VLLPNDKGSEHACETARYLQLDTEVACTRLLLAVSHPSEGLRSTRRSLCDSVTGLGIGSVGLARCWSPFDTGMLSSCSHPAQRYPQMVMLKRAGMSTVHHKRPSQRRPA
jgi:hypothetical protein